MFSKLSAGKPGILSRVFAGGNGFNLSNPIQARSRVFYFCEIKFSRREIGVEVIAEMKQKLSQFPLPTGCAVLPVLIHVNGVTDALLDEQYFSHILNCADLLN
jgi:hypothetical protein